MRRKRLLTQNNLRATPRVKLQLFFRCENLQNQDIIVNSSPILVLSRRDAATGPWLEHSRTEIIKNDLSPVFGKAIDIEWTFEEIQRVRVDIFNTSSDGLFSINDLIGGVEFRVSDIVTASNSTIRAILRGFLIVTSEEIREFGHTVKMRFEGAGLDRKDFLGKSDPYLLINRRQSDAQLYTAVYRTEVIKNTLDPTWREFEMEVQNICNGNMARELNVQVFDWNRATQHEIIGSFKTTLNEMLNGGEYTLVNEKIQEKKKNYSGSGKIRVNAEMVLNSSFLEYIRGGCEFDLIVAIDYSASKNFVSKGRQDVEQAIWAVGSILADYDSDNRFPVFGFGAKVEEGKPSCFALNDNQQDPYVTDLMGIIISHIESKGKYEPGPVLFTPVIEAAGALSSKHNTQGVQRYNILLIITEGKIDDLQSTIDAIVKYENTPLSIVIVGLGHGDFEEMNKLDGDDEPLESSNGTIATRDIVQFVALDKYKGNMEAIARATLEEIPGQLLSYMQKRGFRPNAPIIKPEALFRDRANSTMSLRHSMSLGPNLYRSNSVCSDASAPPSPLLSNISPMPSPRVDHSPKMY
ncbi:hypothetical protein PROFUN_11022 [Planoprotostelium fungivorum]|uniref:Uncharacterized protein n=1 Tax=Planoprotostelium fungivorum TaxID=1890364 RepID=A0A2P6NBS5_9EUKA|nr:hypothetical protein PROFUN_11022 [Planoprotostelium fungivorum]